MTRTVFGADEQADHPVDLGRWVRLAEGVLEEEGVRGDVEVSLLFVDEEAMASLHKRFLGGDGPTDVLAFPIDEPGETPPGAPAILGDVVLCPAVAHEQAASFGRTGPDEVRLLVVHGILHLLGMDHATPEEEREMFGLTDELLASFAQAGR